MAAKFDKSEDAVARERHRDIFIPRPRSRPQGRFSRYLQRQHAQEGYHRRRQGAAIAAARAEARQAQETTEVLLTKMKTMEATLSRVAAMLPSLERLQRRENAAATKIQAAIQGFQERKAVKKGLAKLYDIACHITHAQSPWHCPCDDHCASCLHSEAMLNWCDRVFDTNLKPIYPGVFRGGEFNFRKTVAGGGVLTVLKHRRSVLDLLIN